MLAELLGRADVPGLLAGLPQRPINFDPADMERADPAQGWRTTNLCQRLEPEPPGEPLADGSWEIARALMRGYEFADPSIVRAHYDPDVPLRGRNMVLDLQALGLFHLFVGVRVHDVYECDRDERRARVWGWAYRTLQGHVEMGQMDWEVWKWRDTGEVEFRVHAVSRTAQITNPLVRVGFHLVRGHERELFLTSTCERMRQLTALALKRGAEPVRDAAAELTARPSSSSDAAHDQLAQSLRDRR